jgi:vacuolar protein sorting-associated protein 35
LNTARKQFGEGGVDRIAFTLPPLVILSLRLAQEYKAEAASGKQHAETERKLQTLFKFIHQTITVLDNASHRELALRLFLMPLQDPAILIGFEMIAYEFMVQAFTIYEDSISQNKTQIQTLYQLVGTLHTASNRGIFGRENYDTLITKCALYASKLLKKPDQCRIVLLCSHLFWGRDVEESDIGRMKLFLKSDENGEPTTETTELTGQLDTMHVSAPSPMEGPPSMFEGFGTPAQTTPLPSASSTAPVSQRVDMDSGVLSKEMQEEYVYRDGKRVLECLQKSLKIADSCMDSLVNVQLFTDILNVYIYFYGHGNPSVRVSYILIVFDL